MQATLAPDTHDLALDLYGLLRQMDPVAWRDDAESALRRKLSVVRSRVDGLRGRAEVEPVQDALVEVHALVSDARPSGREQWMALRSRLYPAYERLGERLATYDVHVPSLRPSNTPRSLMHVAMSAVVVGLVATWASTQPRMLAITLTVAGIAWILEATRRLWPRWNDVLMRGLGPIAHDHERSRVNSATWYSTALVALALVGDPIAGIVAFAVLGVGDPMAGLIGRRFGQHKLINGRSMEGTLAFGFFGGLAAFVALWALTPLGVGTALLLAVVGGVSGCLAELYARKVDDNLLIPIVVGLVTWGLGGLLGV